MQDMESNQIIHGPQLTPRGNDVGPKVVPEVTCEKSDDTGNREYGEKPDARDLIQRQVRLLFGSTSSQLG